MKEFVKDKDLIKEAFQALAYFVFLVGVIKLASPEIHDSSILYRVGFLLVLWLLFFLAICYAMLHVSVEITKKYYPDFESPMFGGKSVPFKQAIRSPSYWLWFGVSIPYGFMAWAIINLGLN
ncbi:hypothetical protein [Vibrio hippocampi]|uniref:Uncharacterized protein n=1 Tax=Vibrio hippocampi TaxID=654686 RepID=A0ABN8DKK7_9VIBR|nr:hypothetical protein [Vibrio hippocampi]CAH0529092.1 hypothetical protein VHP8226_03047 [Vibrio hippocampi]